MLRRLLAAPGTYGWILIVCVVVIIGSGLSMWWAYHHMGG